MRMQLVQGIARVLFRREAVEPIEDGEDERAGELEGFEVDPDFDEIDLGEVCRELPAFEPRSREDDEDNG